MRRAHARPFNAARLTRTTFGPAQPHHERRHAAPLDARHLGWRRSRCIRARLHGPSPLSRPGFFYGVAMTIPASFVFAQTSVAVEGPDAARLLLSIIPAPPHQPGIGLVAKNALTCLTALLIEVPAAGSHLAHTHHCASIDPPAYGPGRNHELPDQRWRDYLCGFNLPIAKNNASRPRLRSLSCRHGRSRESCY